MAQVKFGSWVKATLADLTGTFLNLGSQNLTTSTERVVTEQVLSEYINNSELVGNGLFQVSGKGTTFSQATAGEATVTFPETIHSANSIEFDIDAAIHQGANSAYQIDIVFGGSRNFLQNANLSDALTADVKLKNYVSASQLQSINEIWTEERITGAGTVGLRIIIPNAFPTNSTKRRLKIILR